MHAQPDTLSTGCNTCCMQCCRPYLDAHLTCVLVELSQVLIVLATAFVLLRTRLLASYHVMPLNKLLLVRVRQLLHVQRACLHVWIWRLCNHGGTEVIRDEYMQIGASLRASAPAWLPHHLPVPSRGCACGCLRCSAVIELRSAGCQRTAVGIEGGTGRGHDTSAAQGLGCVCGCLGYFAVGKLGGAPQLWLGLWWAWIGGQCALVMNLAAVHALLHPPPSAVAGLGSGSSGSGSRGSDGGGGAGGGGGGISHLPGSQHGPGSSPHSPEGALLPGAGLDGGDSGWRRAVRGAVKPAFVIGAAIWFPLMMGCMPFDRSAVAELRKLIFA